MWLVTVSRRHSEIIAEIEGLNLRVLRRERCGLCYYVTSNMIALAGILGSIGSGPQCGVTARPIEPSPRRSKNSFRQWYEKTK